MENVILSAEEQAEYGAYKRSKREAEIAFALQKLVVDASARGTDRAVIKSACECAKRVHACAVRVQPVHLAQARKLLQGSKIPLSCAVGGTGESFLSVKKAEVKKAARRGAGDLLFAPCYSALFGKNFSYLKREFRQMRKAAKKQTLVIALDDVSIGEEELSVAIRAAVASGADGVLVRGEGERVSLAVQLSRGKLFVEAADVTQSEILRTLIKAGAARAVTPRADFIAAQLASSLSSDPLPEGGQPNQGE